MTAGADPSRRLAPAVRLAPAKVNLTLAVLGTRSDGFHDLHSVMVPIALADRLSLAVLPPGGSDTLHVDGFDPGPAADNLVLRAIAAARRRVREAGFGPALPPPLAARLEKRIPVAAGLAGGSSDAAAAVDAALEAWGVELDPATRRDLAAELGSDVPFFLAGGPALVEGRGERLTPLPWLRGAAEHPDRPGLLLVTPAVAVSTPSVFRAWDAGAGMPGGAARLASAHLADELRRGVLRPEDLVARASVLAAANDLAPAAAAVEPALVPFKRSLLRLLGRPVGVSGSGPTHWALYASSGEAAEACGRLRSAAASGELAAPRPAGAVHRGHHHPRPSTGEPVMTRDAISTRGAPAAIGPYSQGIAMDGLLFCSGQLGLDPATGDLVAGVEAQAERSMLNLRAVLDAAGLTFEDVVKTTIFLADMGDFAVVNAVYGRFMPDPPPARSTVQVAALPKGGLVEIEAIALRPADG